MFNPLGMLGPLSSWMGREGAQGAQFVGHEGMDGLRWLQRQLGMGSAGAQQPVQPSADQQGMFGAGVGDPAALPGTTITPASAGTAGRYSPRASAADGDEKWKPSLLRTIDDAFGGMTFSQSRDAQRAARDADLQGQQLYAYARQVIHDPREWALFLGDPKGWLAAQKSRYEFQKIGGGDTYGNLGGDSGIHVAPKLETFGDRPGIVTANPDGSGLNVQYGTPRSPTFAESSEDTYRKAQADAEAQRLQEAGRHNRATEGVAQKRENRIGVAKPAAGLPAGFVVEHMPNG